jgi:hypothetical protein
MTYFIKTADTPNITLPMLLKIVMRQFQIGLHNKEQRRMGKRKVTHAFCIPEISIRNSVKEWTD